MRDKERERRRYRKKEKKKPYSKKCIFIGCFSALFIALYIAALSYCILARGETGKIIPGILMIFFVVCLFFLVIGFKEFKGDSNINDFSKKFGFFLPLLAVVVFLLTYVIGLITGGVI